VESAEKASSKRDDDLVLTEACVRRLRGLAEEENSSTDQKRTNEMKSETMETEPSARASKGPLLRVAVDGCGCSGFQYAFSLEVDSGVSPKDLVFERDGARVVVDDISFEFVRGATIDYVEEMIKSSFAISNNPNSDGSCGCGVSFAAK
jgi:iron-sulfur cluster assembly accessory protein